MPPLGLVRHQVLGLVLVLVLQQLGVLVLPVMLRAPSRFMLLQVARVA